MKSLPRSIIILRRTLLGLAVAVTVVAAAVVEENVRGNRDWRRFRQLRAESGLPLDFAFYAPPPAPDDQNLMRTPFLGQFFNPEDGTAAAWVRYRKQLTIPWEAAGAAHLPLAQTGFLAWQNGVPYDFAMAMWVDRGQGAPKPAAAAAARQFLSALAPIKGDLDALDAAAQWRTRSQIPFLADGSLVPGSFAALRELSKVLGLRASAELQVGEVNAAYADTYADLRLAEACVHYPTVLHALFGNILIERAIQPLWEGWIRGAWTDEQLRSFQSAVTPFHTYLEVGRIVASTSAAVAAEDESRWPGPWWMPQGWRREAAIQTLDRGAAGALQRLDTEHRPLTLQNLERLFLLRDEQRARFPLRFIPDTDNSIPILYPQVLRNMAVGQTALQLSSTACALLRFRRAVGKYPTDLGALVPDYLPAVPFDYLDGARLRYHPTPEGGFVLYSVGRDGRDDDGALPLVGGKSRFWGEDGEAGDWTWPTQVNPAPPGSS